MHFLLNAVDYLKHLFIILIALSETEGELVENYKGQHLHRGASQNYLDRIQDGASTVK